VKAKFAGAVVTGILGGIAFTLFLLPLAALDVIAVALAAWGAFSTGDARSVITFLGYLLYPVCGVIFLSAGFMAARWAGRDLDGKTEAAVLSAIAGVTAGILRAIAYDLLDLLRPIAESVAVTFVMTRSLNLHTYIGLLSGNDVLGSGDPAYVVAHLAAGSGIAGPVILLASVALAIAGGLGYATFFRKK
jgi:hypothetical protein